MNNNFSEKESLELISQMLQQTRQNLKVGDGNIFLYYGYSALIISILVYAMVYFSANHAWAALWFLLFIPGLIIKISGKKRKDHVVTTYTDKAIINIWRVIRILFSLTAIAIIISGLYLKEINFSIMLPLSLLYSVIGTSLTGIIMNEKILMYTPMFGFFIAIYMLMALNLNNSCQASWYLYFGIAFIFMMIIPGHIINKKSINQCSKN